MANNTVKMVIRGKTSYAKVLGDPVLNYSKDGKEWKMDLVIDKDTVKEFKDAGIGDRVKSKPEYLDGQYYVTFKQAEFRRNGEKNDPITVVDILGDAWDQKKLLGNGTDVDVTFAVADHGPGKKKGMYIRQIRVLKLVPYDGANEAPPINPDDPFFAEAEAARARKAMEDEQFKKDFGLNDTVDDIGETDEAL